MRKRQKRIDEATVLLPLIIADGVVGEAYRLTGIEIPHLSPWLAARAERIYRRNDFFAKRVRAKDGREFLYAFMRHWTAALILKKYGKRVNQEWALGAELSR